MKYSYPDHPVIKLKNIKDLVYSSAQRFSSDPFYIYIEKKQKKTYTYADNKAAFDALGTKMFSLGLKEKNCALIGDQHPDWIAAYLASVACGGAVVPLDRELSPTAVKDFVTVTECKILFTCEKVLYSLKTDDEELLPGVEHIVVIGAEPDDKAFFDTRVVKFDDFVSQGQKLLDAGEKAFVEYERDPDTLASVLFTSGTTGTSKGVMLAERQIVSSIEVCLTMIECDNKENFVSVLPIHHTFGLTCNHIGVMHIGACVMLNDSVKHALRNFVEYKPTVLILVPLYLETMDKKIWEGIRKKGKEKQVKILIKISNFLRKFGIDLRRVFFKEILDVFGGRLYRIVCGGAPLNPEIIKNFDSFGVYVAEGYGITECTPLISVNPFNCRKIGSVGMVAAGMEAKISDPDSEGNGEILVRGRTVFDGYYKNEEATKDAFTFDGWFKTGDVGHIDADNFVYITGRKKNVIIASNGKNVYPEELEEYLRDIETITESVVVGRLKNGETVITAIVYPNFDLFKDADDDTVLTDIKAKINKLNKTLPAFKQIHDVELRKTEFEKTTTRKIKRFLVK